MLRRYLQSKVYDQVIFDIIIMIQCTKNSVHSPTKEIHALVLLMLG